MTWTVAGCSGVVPHGRIIRYRAAMIVWPTGRASTRDGATGVGSTGTFCSVAETGPASSRKRGGDSIEFLVRIDVHLPVDMPAEQRQALMVAERARGRELMARGALKRIWRIPGRLSNYSLYDVRDATELHGLLSSLPLWSWTAMQVEPLAVHPLEAPGEP